MIILISLSTVPPVRTSSATVLCETTAYYIFISQSANVSFVSPREERLEIKHIITVHRM